MPKRKRSPRSVSGRMSYKRRVRLKSPKKSFRRKVPLALKSHTFVERFSDTDELLVGGDGLFKTFKLDDLAQVASYKTLFEYYTIKKVVINFRYKLTVAYNDPDKMTPNEINPVLWFKIDHNDVTADTLATMKKSTRTHSHQFSNDKPEFSITCKPAILTESYRTAISSTYSPAWGKKVSMNDSNVPHYGLKCYAEGPGGQTYPGTMQVSYKLYFTAKNNE